MKNNLLVLLLVTGWVSCKNNGDRTPDISHIKAEVVINRFDRDFFSMDTVKLAAAINNLHRQHPVFAKNYFEYYTPLTRLLAGGLAPDAVVRKYLYDIKPLYDSVAPRFKNIGWLEKELSLAFRYAKYYFPFFKIPAVYTTVEALNPDDPEEIFGTIYYRDTLSISLQMYAGGNFSGYDPERYFDYLRRRFEPEYITRNAMRTIINTHFPEKPSLSLVNQMMEAGRRLYVLDKLLPDVPAEIKLGYTKAQYKDCIANEKLIWSHFINNHLLYSEEPSMNREYIGESPFTKELGTDSPGNIGAFTGWQIVKKYMKKHSELPLDELLNADLAEIFSEAVYKPG
jgi:hypothetical protein